MNGNRILHNALIEMGTSLMIMPLKIKNQKESFADQIRQSSLEKEIVMKKLTPKKIDLGKALLQAIKRRQANTYLAGYPLRRDKAGRMMRRTI